MTTNLIQLEPRGMWSIQWLENLFSGYEFQRFNGFPDNEGGVVLIPAEYWADRVAEINLRLSRMPWAVVILASDECGLFPVEKLVLPAQSTLWVMTPHFEKHTYPVGTQFMGEMYPDHAREEITENCPVTYPERKYDWSFSGQVTHERRTEMVAALENVPNGYLNKTAGFTQGLGHAEYASILNESITVPAPSGPCTLDSFRAYEALEAGCIPILDGVCPIPQDGEEYWRAVLGDKHPLAVVTDWSQAADLIEDNAAAWPSENLAVFSWWQMYKRELRHRILSGIPGHDAGRYTILMPTSVIPSHPSTAKIEAVIKSVRYHHPNADILIMCDGVRDEQLHRSDAYNEYLLRLFDICNYRYDNVYPIMFESFQHQANMTRWTLDYVHTPLILFVEHDIQLVTDMPINWTNIGDLVEIGDVDVVKFSFESMGIHPEHEYMALDKEIVNLHGVPVRRSVQWSQRPHVARTEYYRRMIHDHFPPSNRTMIEDRMHSVAQEFPDRHRLATYMPEGSKLRCFHIDGRENDTKYEMIYE